MYRWAPSPVKVLAKLMSTEGSSSPDLELTKNFFRVVNLRVSDRLYLFTEHHLREVYDVRQG